MAASTGSGKTLAFVLPVIQQLVIQEQQLEENSQLKFVRMNQRPRCIILTPTRELAEQTLAVIKEISHHVKVSSCAVLGGEPYSVQKKSVSTHQS